MNRSCDGHCPDQENQSQPAGPRPIIPSGPGPPPLHAETALRRQPKPGRPGLGPAQSRARPGKDETSGHPNVHSVDFPTLKKLTALDLVETCVFSTEHPELASQGVWRIGFTTVSKSHQRPSNGRDEKFGHVHLCLAGSAQVLTGNGWHDLQAGQAWVCPPGRKAWIWSYRCYNRQQNT